MEIKVKIEAPELATAINNVAVALAAMANAPIVTTEKETVAAPVTKTPDEEVKPADLKKQKIADEIIALGGTPPEKGSVAKFEAALEALKEAQEGEGEGEDDDDEGDEDISLDDVRTLAHAVIKSDPENAAKGKVTLGGCLKMVKAENLTKATQKQLNKIVPMLEEYLGKSIAEVLAEAAD